MIGTLVKLNSSRENTSLQQNYSVNNAWRNCKHSTAMSIVRLGWSLKNDSLVFAEKTQFSHLYWTMVLTKQIHRKGDIPGQLPDPTKPAILHGLDFCSF